MTYELLGLGIALFFIGLMGAALIGGSIGMLMLLSGIGLMGAGMATALTGTRGTVSRGRDW